MNKRVLVAIFLIVLCFVLMGCTLNENVLNQENIPDVPSGEDEISEVTLNKEEKVIANKYVVKVNDPITYTSDKGEEIGQDMWIGKYKTYEMVNVENPNNEESIDRINEVLNSWKDYIDEEEYETILPEDTEYFQDFRYTSSEFYQDEKILVIKEVYSGASGGGAANNNIMYYVFDKNTGERLTLEDISNNPDALIEYIYYKPAMDDLNEYTNWWYIDLGNSQDLRRFKDSIEGHWTIDEEYITVCRSGGLSGPSCTIKYSLKNINNDLYKNIKDEYMH